MSQSTFLSVRSDEMRLLFASNVTTTLTEPVSTITEPTDTSEGFMRMGAGGIAGGAGVKLMFLANSTQTDITANIYGYEKILQANATTGTPAPLWTPTLLCSLGSISFNTSNQPGVTSSPVATTLAFAYAITGGTVGTAGTDWAVSSGVAGQIAHVIVSSKGAKWIRVVMGKGSASAVNCVGKAV